MIEQTRVEKLIDESNGRIFSVRFVKKDGSIRNMVCRKAVRKGVKGVREGWNARSAKGRPLRTVFDMNKAAFRTIPTDRILRVRVNGEVYSD